MITDFRVLTKSLIAICPIEPYRALITITRSIYRAGLQLHIYVYGFLLCITYIYFPTVERVRALPNKDLPLPRLDDA